MDESNRLYQYLYWSSITMSHGVWLPAYQPASPRTADSTPTIVPAVWLGFFLVSRDVPYGLSLTYLTIDVVVCYFRQVEVRGPLSLLCVARG